MENITLMQEHGYIKDGKVFLKGYLNYPDRQIGEVKRTEQDAIDYFKNRYSIAESKVNQLEQEVEEAQNKGSYLTKLLQLRQKLLGFDAIGDFPVLLAKLDQLESYLTELIQVNQIKNLEIKRALIEDAEEAARIEDWQEGTDKLQEIKAKWIRTGSIDKIYGDEIEANFQQILDDFFQRRREHFAEQNQIIQQRIDAYEDLIKQAKTLTWMSDLDEAYKKARQLRFAWNEVGEVPPKKFFKISKAYRHFVKLFYDKYNNAKGIEPKVKIDPRILEQQKILAQAEYHLKNDTIEVAADQTKVLLSKWREIRLPFKLADKELAEKFRNVCDKVFELSYLRRVLLRKYPAFDLKSPEEQIRTKMKEMEWLVKREKTDLEIAIQMLESNPPTDEESLKQRNGSINIQKRKVAMKERILKEFERELLSV
ncbi:hypothetical protein GCM10023091_37230 [Ravibacter arvi]|uniref:DUF349 domain-containing protein n=1 Tax=Ravibacter arvi TaxID=2051041 RepID=A0ABP8M938_9BACT